MTEWETAAAVRFSKTNCYFEMSDPYFHTFDVARASPMGNFSADGYWGRDSGNCDPDLET